MIGAPQIRLNVLTNDVYVDGVRLGLSDRESELCTVMTLRGGYMDAEAIAGAMWSDADIIESIKALRVYISRLRKILPSPDILKSEKNGYALEAAFRVDLWEIDLFLRDQRKGRPSHAFPFEEYEQLYRRLQQFHGTQRIRSIRWSWFASVELQIDGYRREVGLELGAALLERGRLHEARRIAQDLVVADPLCELARELGIKVELALNNYALAVKQYRVFEMTLRDELRANPSPRLRHLLAAHLLA